MHATEAGRRLGPRHAACVDRVSTRLQGLQARLEASLLAEQPQSGAASGSAALLPLLYLPHSQSQLGIGRQVSPLQAPSVCHRAGRGLPDVIVPLAGLMMT